MSSPIQKGNMEKVLDRIRRAEKLPSLPVVTLETLKLLNQEDQSIDRLVDLIKRDPALTATILKVVNSPFYGLARRVSSIRDATTIIGLSTLKLLVVSVSLVGALKNSNTRKLDHASYWRRSLFTAVASMLLARALSQESSEDAFLSGLLADIGILAALQTVPEEYLPVMEAWTSRKKPLAVLEMEKFGFTHAVMGREMLRAWNLPENLYKIVGAHNGEGLDDLDTSTLKLAGIVRSASTIAELFCQDMPAANVDNVKSSCLSEIGISPQLLEDILNAMSKHVSELALLLSLPVGNAMSYEQLLKLAEMESSHRRSS
jgi:HD-like signal output (HDOD) protein